MKDNNAHKEFGACQISQKCLAKIPAFKTKFVYNSIKLHELAPSCSTLFAQTDTKGFSPELMSLFNSIYTK